MKKVYDSVEWCFLEQILDQLCFPQEFITWIMKCVTTVSYSILINGNPMKPFPVKKGLRQGDPMSPFLFVLVMEYFTRMLKGLKGNKSFKFYPKCAKINIIQLSFADDLLLFCKGDMESVKALYASFQIFSKVFGLEANVEKRSIYFGGVNQTMQLDILHHLGFLKGRLQLIKSVLFSIQTFWSQIFTLPRKLIQMIESVCKRFLWTGGVDVSHRALIAWDRICMPKDKLWVKWIHYYYGRRASLWKSKPMQAYWIVQKIIKVAEYLEEVGIQEEELSQMQCFTIQKMYKKFQGEYPKCSWRRLICNNYRDPRWLFVLYLKAPRWLFVLYLNLHERLLTRDRVAKWSQIDDLSCPLCAREPESAEHLFFKCGVTSQIWDNLLEWQGVQRKAKG
ncbi:uncharacterized protein LOC142164816 [Nicotiana tabacum]|uniref:Uncharacterized protein LOC142164816 n=1 Tax=Nicotiana tabacum TaxID=4097 RepID=A0AC58S3T6_TOBAC